MDILFKRKSISDIDWENGSAIMLAGIFISIAALFLYLFSLEMCNINTGRAYSQTKLDSIINGAAAASVTVSSRDLSTNEAEDVAVDYENSGSAYYDDGKIKDYLKMYHEVINACYAGGVSFTFEGSSELAVRADGFKSNQYDCRMTFGRNEMNITLIAQTGKVNGQRNALMQGMNKNYIDKMVFGGQGFAGALATVESSVDHVNIEDDDAYPENPFLICNAYTKGLSSASGGDYIDTNGHTPPERYYSMVTQFAKIRNNRYGDSNYGSESAMNNQDHAGGYNQGCYVYSPSLRLVGDVMQASGDIDIGTYFKKIAISERSSEQHARYIGDGSVYNRDELTVEEAFNVAQQEANNGKFVILYIENKGLQSDGGMGRFVNHNGYWEIPSEANKGRCPVFGTEDRWQGEYVFLLPDNIDATEHGVKNNQNVLKRAIVSVSEVRKFIDNPDTGELFIQKDGWLPVAQEFLTAAEVLEIYIFDSQTYPNGMNN